MRHPCGELPTGKLFPRYFNVVEPEYVKVVQLDDMSEWQPYLELISAGFNFVLCFSSVFGSDIAMLLSLSGVDFVAAAGLLAW